MVGLDLANSMLNFRMVTFADLADMRKPAICHETIPSVESNTDGLAIHTHRLLEFLARCSSFKINVYLVAVDKIPLPVFIMYLSSVLIVKKHH